MLLFFLAFSQRTVKLRLSHTGGVYHKRCKWPQPAVLLQFVVAQDVDVKISWLGWIGLECRKVRV